MKKAGIKMSFALGGTSSAICALQDKGLVDYILDTQDFDQGAAAHLFSNPHHIEIDLSEYANAGNKGAYVNKLDYVVLSALEIDTKFNVNVITGSDGVLRGAPGGHPDTAAGSKCCIIVTPLTRGRMATVCIDGRSDGRPHQKLGQPAGGIHRPAPDRCRDRRVRRRRDRR